MNAFIWMMFILLSLKVAASLSYFALDKYPVDQEITAAWAVVFLIGRLGIVIWAGALLFS